MLAWLKRLPRLIWDSLRLGGSGLLGALLLGLMLVLLSVLLLVVLPLAGLFALVATLYHVLTGHGVVVRVRRSN